MASKKATTKPIPSQAQNPPLSPAPAPAPASVPSKKPRKNPARRKAERANTTNMPAPQQAKTSNGGSGQSATSLPPKPSRQASAPSVPSNASTAKVPQQQKKSSKTAATAVAASKPETTTPSAPTPSRQPSTTTALTQTQTPTPPRPTPHRSTTTTNTTTALPLHGPALITGGLIGCAAGAALLMAIQIWYDFAGAKAAIATARSARFCVDNLSEELITSLHAGTYSTDEALDILRRTTLAYASTMPGGAGGVEKIFREVQAVRRTRGEEVDGVLAGAYEELRRVGERGAGAAETREVMLRHLGRLGLVGGRAAREVLDRNPRLKTWRDGAVGALREPENGKVPTARVNLVVKHR